jgi:hypothetical protein
MLALRDYFKYNERWETGTSDRAGIDARNALGIMRILARKRRMEIQRQRKERKRLLKEKKNE